MCISLRADLSNKWSSQLVRGLSADKWRRPKRDYLEFMSGRLKHRRLGGKDSRLSVGASCRVSNKDWSTMEPFQVKRPCGSKTQTAFPLASPQVVQTRKQSRSRNCRAENSLQIPFNPWPGQANSSVSAWRAGWTVFSQGSSFLLPALGRPHEKKYLFSLQKHGDFPTFISSSQLENFPGDVSMNLTTKCTKTN